MVRPNKLLSFRIMFSLVLTSCNPGFEDELSDKFEFKEEKVARSDRRSPKKDPHKNLIDKNETETNIEKIVDTYDRKLKTFSQLNMTFSKLTGVPRNEVSQVYNQVLNQLPAGYDLSSYTAFNQISIARLSFSYCDKFVESDQEFSAIDYRSVADGVLVNKLVNRFLDLAPSDEPNYYGTLKQNLLKTLANEPIGDMGRLINEGNDSDAEVKIKSTKTACALTLSSPYVVFI